MAEYDEENGSQETLFVRLRSGDSSAREELFAVVYSELHSKARGEMARESPMHTLQPTALVNEVFLKLSGGELPELRDREHFLRLCGKMMRQILVDYSRQKHAVKRADPNRRVELDDWLAVYEKRSGGLIALDAALERLQLKEPELVRLVELRFFAGRSMDEIATLLGVSPRTAASRWQDARDFLKDELQA